jgi:hypothetical protein
MLFTIANTIDSDRPVKRIVDANGLEYRWALEIDTETGRIEKIAEDSQGRRIIKNGEFQHETVFATPPILVLFDGPSDVPRWNHEVVEINDKEQLS